MKKYMMWGGLSVGKTHALVKLCKLVPSHRVLCSPERLDALISAGVPPSQIVLTSELGVVPCRTER